MLTPTDHRKDALEFVQGLNFDDAYFKILLKLACISSSAKIHIELYGLPERCEWFEVENNPFWHKWDFGRALVKLLVEYCRPRNVDPSNSHFWQLLNNHYQQSYFEQYEFEKEVKLELNNFEALCNAIMKGNIICIGDFKLSPNDVAEADGHYGELVFWRKWLLEQKERKPLELQTDSYSLAEKVFEIVNLRKPSDCEKGEVSKKLNWYSRSCYD